MWYMRKWCARNGLSAALLMVFCATAFPLWCQQGASLDLTKISPRHRLREPASSGSGGSLAPVSDNPAVVRRNPLRLDLTVLGGTALKPGQEFLYEIKIQNVGEKAITLPWDPNSADIEPEDPTKSYDYKAAALGLTLEMNANKEIGLKATILLYGSPSQKDTWIVLQPGESLRVRAKGIVSPANPNENWRSRLSSGGQIQATLKASLMFSSSRFSVTAGHSREDSRINDVDTVKSGPVPVTLVSD